MFKTVYHTSAPTKGVEMYEIDAKIAVANFPKEWSTEAWPEDVAKAAEGEQAPSDPPPPGDPNVRFEARDKGHGWWGVFDSSDNQIGDNLRKPEAESFNGLSDEDKAEWVKSELAKS
jgi:hypothetical protein